MGGRRGLYRFDEVRMSGGAAALRQPAGFAPRRPPATLPASAPARAAPEPFSLVVDLGARIGSRDWIRGAATCFALCYAASAFWPSLASTPGLSPAPLAADQWEEARAMAITPLALGADTGRRMAPTDAVQPLMAPPERPVVELRTTLTAPGELVAALVRAGVAQNEAESAATMIGRATPLAEIAAGTIVDLRLGRRDSPSVPRPLEKLSLRASFSLKIEVERADGRLILNRLPIAVDTTPLRIQGTVGASLYRSARAAGVPARTVEAYIRALSTQIGVPSGLSAGDRFDLIISHRRAATGEVEVGDLLYAGLDRARGRDLHIMPWNVGGSIQWFEASGVGRETSSGFRMPVQGRMTSPYGYRIHPILRYRRLHTGIDFGAPYGAPIVAAASGRVVLAGWNGGYGKTVRIAHGNDLLTLYGHMSRIAVSPGQQVAAGQVIGYVGSTGMSTGPHLHYELHRGGERINPASFRFTQRSQLTGGDLAAFQSRLRALLAVPVGARPQPNEPGFSSAALAPPGPAPTAPRVGQW
jgi:murein DD-endopeptidase MepM/ murein hydrolase activator NlpD